jgi:hypothetical protein
VQRDQFGESVIGAIPEDLESGRVTSRVIIRFLAECGTARSAAVIRELDTVLLGAG